MRMRSTRPGTQQLSLALDATKLSGIGPTERSRAMPLLAKLLLEAAGVAITERTDERG